MAREVCTSRRISTNTPLQALVTLNVEASLHFAKRMIDEGGDKASDQIRYGYKLMMNKDIPDQKLEVFLHLYNQFNEEGLIKNVARQTNESADEKHKKAISIVANAMFNIDEFIMKN